MKRLPSTLVVMNSEFTADVGAGSALTEVTAEVGTGFPFTEVAADVGAGSASSLPHAVLIIARTAAAAPAVASCV